MVAKYRRLKGGLVRVFGSWVRAALGCWAPLVSLQGGIITLAVVCGAGGC